MKSFPDSTSAAFAKFVFKLHSYVRTIGSSHLSTIQNKKLNIQNLRITPLTHSLLNPLIPRRLPAAFSLTEVVIAMGVAAVAFTSIIALFPLGLGMSKESYEETQAALIAQTILADLQDEGTGSAPLGSSRSIQIGGNSDPNNSSNYLTINFNTNSPFTFYLAYNQLPRTSNDTDPTGQPSMMRPTSYSTNPADFYNSGINGLSAVVKVTVMPCFRINGAGASGDPKRVDVSIETPGNVTNKNRSQFLFTGGTPPG
jgi:type II secretory pathway pseudopilin PulG